MGMKEYTMATRKPMMYGGQAMRKKRAAGTPKEMQGESAGMNADTAPDREALQRRRGQLLRGIEDTSLSDEVRAEMRRTLAQIEDKLGMSATPGRMSVDGPSE